MTYADEVQTHGLGWGRSVVRDQSSRRVTGISPMRFVLDDDFGFIQSVMEDGITIYTPSAEEELNQIWEDSGVEFN